MNINPKKLTLTEMWELHNLLKDGLVGNEHEYLIDEISEILGKITQQKFILSLNILYKKLSFENKNPVEIVVLFIRGLKKNNFFEFAAVVKELHGSSKR